MLLATRLHFLSTMPTKKDNSYCVKRKTACNSHAHSEIVTDGCAFTLRKTVGMTQKPTISGAVVRDGRLELPTSCSQSKRATNCANPGFLVIQFCTRCGQTCGHGYFLTTSTCGGSACIAGVSRDCGHGIFWLEGGATRSQTRRDTNFAIPGYSLSAMIPRRGVKIKIFLSVVIPVVKAAFVPFSAIGENPANAGAARLCGVSPYSASDTATALPKQARYQLRYTRLLS